MPHEEEFVLKLNTAATTYPVTRGQAKEHLRLDSGSYSGNITTIQCIAPDAYAAATQTGTSTQLSGAQVLFNLSVGDISSGGTLDVGIYDSDDDSTFEFVESFTQVNTTTDNAVFELEYTGIKDYVTAKATVSTAACDFGVNIVKNLQYSSEDDYLDTLIIATTEHIESAVLNRSLITQTWEYYLDGWPYESYIELPRPPLQSITSVTYTDAGDSSEYGNTFAATNYTANIERIPGRLQLKANKVFPATFLETDNPIKIIYIAGYGATRTSVPQVIKHCQLILIADLYNNRQTYVDERNLKTVDIIEKILTKYRNWVF